MRCPEIQEKITAFYDGELREAERADVEAHLRQCPACQREWAALQTTSRLMQTWQAPRVSPHLRATFMAKLEERAARKPWWAMVFVGWQRQVAWATAAAVVLLMVAFNVRQQPAPIEPPDVARDRTAAAPPSVSMEEKGSRSLMAENKAGAATLAIEPERRTEKRPPRQRNKERKLLLTLKPSVSSVTSARATHLGVRGKDDTSTSRKEGNAKDGFGNVLVVAAPEEAATAFAFALPPEEATNLVRGLIAEMNEPIPVVDLSVWVEKRPERILTDWLTEAGD
jgi:negative regulator of sigma E activity